MLIFSQKITDVHIEEPRHLLLCIRNFLKVRQCDCATIGAVIPIVAVANLSGINAS